MRGRSDAPRPAVRDTPPRAAPAALGSTYDPGMPAPESAPSGLAADFPAATRRAVARAGVEGSGQVRPAGGRRPGRGARDHPPGRHRGPPALHGATTSTSLPALPAPPRSSAARPPTARPRPAGTCAPATPTRTRSGRTRRRWPTSSAAPRRCGWCSATGGLAVDDLPAALDGVLLDLAPIALDAGADTLAAADALLALAGERAASTRPTLRGSFGADPIGAARTQRMPTPTSACSPHCTAAPGCASRRSTAPSTTTPAAATSTSSRSRPSVGVAYLRALVDGGVAVDDALAAIEFRFAVTAQQFGSIAKLRAARRLWVAGGRAVRRRPPTVAGSASTPSRPRR